MTGIPFPDIDPIAISLGPLHIRWYGLAYLAGFLGGWFYAGWLADLDRDRRPNREDIDNLLPLLVLGVILGGRIGYVLFYNLDLFMAHPLDMFKVWEGGMSFHGGLLGVACAILGFAWKNKIPPIAIGDIISTVVPIGLFFGRIANFINGELYGRITTVPWAIVFPRGHDVPRHPSQLYEAFLEGICLFTVMFLLARNATIRRTPGLLFGTFLIGYGLCRATVEYFREPDEQIGFIFQYFSMGQLLSLPMIIAGIIIIIHAKKHKTSPAR
jgi:phosphatidylglycerol:prolipoprotein diacylglycerol transferase